MFSVHFSYNIKEMLEKNRLRRKIGQWGENMAYQFYENKGYSIIAKNVHTPYGEIDLIVKKSAQLAFVEVKTRTSMAFGYPEESISETKRIHMIQSAEAFLQENPEFGESWQIDVLSIQRLRGSGEIRYTWFENALA
jgi:putative endonuclease